MAFILMRRLALCCDVQACLSRLKRRGLGTRLWGPPGADAGSVAADPHCLWSVRKISSQVISRVFRPRRVVTLMSPVKQLDQNVNLKGSIAWQHRIDEFTKFMASCLKGPVIKSVG